MIVNGKKVVFEPIVRMYTYYENEMIDTLNQVIVTLCHVSQEGDKKTENKLNNAAVLKSL